MRRPTPDELRAATDRSEVWVLPNPSGLNAHYQLPALAAAYAELRSSVDGSGSLIWDSTEDDN